MADLSLGRVAVKTMSLFLPQKQNFVFATQAGQEAFYLRETLEDFGYQQQNATEIYEHLLLCVSIPYAEIFLRHIYICCCFVRDLVKASYVKLIHLRIHKMVADALESAFAHLHRPPPRHDGSNAF